MDSKEELTAVFTVSEQEVGPRLDKLLTCRFPEHSRAYFQFLIEQACVLVNGLPIKKREIPKVDDEIELYFVLPPEISLEPQDIPLEILYEDTHIIAVNKPAGMVVHPAPGHPRDTFVNALLFHCHNLEAGTDPLRPGIVHRLDKDTSGVLLAAKTPQAHAKLVELFSLRQMKKYYLAVCVGIPREGLIDAAIKRHPTKRKEMAVNLTEGKEAKSICRHLGKNESLSLVEVQLLTGRTHQIRVHMKHVGAPILGDAVYGSSTTNQRYSPSRQLLHAHRLEFIHPITGSEIKLCAPIPKDLLHYTEFLK